MHQVLDFVEFQSILLDGSSTFPIFVPFSPEMHPQIGGVWDCSASCFAAPLYVFQPNGFSSMHSVQEKKGGVVRAPKEVLHKLQFFVELLHGGVCGAVPNTPIVCTT